MIHRSDRDGTLLIGQPAHAWMSGRMARAWKWPFQPWEDVCLAAEQHDIGMAAWDARPELDPATGLPYSFTSMPREMHVGLWSKAARLMLPQGRYAALLVSLHGTGLYERYVPADQLAASRPGATSRLSANSRPAMRDRLPRSRPRWMTPPRCFAAGTGCRCSSAPRRIRSLHDGGRAEL